MIRGSVGLLSRGKSQRRLEEVDQGCLARVACSKHKNIERGRVFASSNLHLLSIQALSSKESLLVLGY